MNETYTQVRPFVIFFISSILSILCGLFFFFGLGGREREGRGCGVVAYGYRILHLQITLAPSPLQCTVYRKDNRKDYRRVRILFRMNEHYFGKLDPWIRK
jgi:hypothetical protein